MKDYWIRIKANIGIFSTKKTSCLLDGTYQSIYKGNGMNFEDLREYIPGDDVRSIDWKASARSRQFLVKQFVAEKKHNIMLAFDTTHSMAADTEAVVGTLPMLDGTKKTDNAHFAEKGKNASQLATNGMERADGKQKETDTPIKKYDLATLAAGTLAYMGAKNGDNIGAIFDTGSGMQYYQPQTGLYQLERILADYQSKAGKAEDGSLERALSFLVNHTNRNMVLILVTDEMGIKNISEGLLTELRYRCDILVISISDAYLFGRKSYDAETSRYVPSFVSRNRRLQKEEANIRQQLEWENSRKLLHHGVVCTRITGESEEEIPEKIVELLHAHKGIRR